MKTTLRDIFCRLGSNLLTCSQGKLSVLCKGPHWSVQQMINDPCIGFEGPVGHSNQDMGCKIIKGFKTSELSLFSSLFQ